MQNLKPYDGKRNGIYIVFLQSEDNKKVLDIVKVYSNDVRYICHVEQDIYTRKLNNKAYAIVPVLSSNFKLLNLINDGVHVYLSESDDDYSDIIKKSNIDINAVEVIKTE